MSWDEIVSRSEAARERIRAALLGLSEFPSDAESEFVDETFDHYDEHAAEIRTVRRFLSLDPSILAPTDATPGLLPAVVSIHDTRFAPPGSARRSR